jgi:chromosome segregation and condensation protein ScpB
MQPVPLPIQVVVDLHHIAMVVLVLVVLMTKPAVRPIQGAVERRYFVMQLSTRQAHVLLVVAVTQPASTSRYRVQRNSTHLQFGNMFSLRQ